MVGWHALTADDSVYAFEIQGDPDTPASRYLNDRTASYEATPTRPWCGPVSPATLTPSTMPTSGSPSRKLWQDDLGLTAADLIEAEESSRMPMGLGRVRRPGVGLRRSHHRGEEPQLPRRRGLPYVDTVIYRFVSDSNAAVAQL